MTEQNARRPTQAVPAAQIRPPINPFLGLLPKSLWNRQKDLFFYVAEFLPLNVSATASVEVVIQADSDFLITYGVAVVTDTSDVTVASVANAFAPFNPPFLATITDSGSGRAFMSSGVSFANLFGTGTLPAIWPFPKLIKASSVLSTKLQNLVATAYRIRIAYGGFKVFNYQGD